MSFDYIISRFNTSKLGTSGLTPENLPSRIEKDFVYTPLSKTLYIFLPTWAETISRLSKTKKYVISKGGSFLAYNFPPSILSDDYKNTLECFLVVKDLVKKEISNLKRLHNFTKCVIVGGSLGVIYTTMIANDNKDIDEVILETFSNSLAEALWTGCRTQHLRKSFEEQGVTLHKLIEYWHDLAPENNLNLHGKKISLFLSEADKVILPHLGRKLHNAMRKKALNVNFTKNNYLGHYLTLEYFYIYPEKLLNL